MTALLNATAEIVPSLDSNATAAWQPYNSWDRLPFLTDVKFGNGTGSISLAFNKLVSNFFFTGSPYSIDTDDGSDMVNATANVVYKQPLFKTDFGGVSVAALSAAPLARV